MIWLGILFIICVILYIAATFDEYPKVDELVWDGEKFIIPKK